MTDFKKGDEILVSLHGSGKNARWGKRIFVEILHGAKYPFICVDKVDEDNFKKGEKFAVALWGDAKPIEAPKLTLEQSVISMDWFDEEVMEFWALDDCAYRWEPGFIREKSKWYWNERRKGFIGYVYLVNGDVCRYNVICPYEKDGLLLQWYGKRCKPSNLIGCVVMKESFYE